MGIALLPPRTIRGLLDSGDLSNPAWTGEPNETSVIMIRHKDRWCSPLLSRFMELVRDHMELPGS